MQIFSDIYVFGENDELARLRQDIIDKKPVVSRISSSDGVLVFHGYMTRRTPKEFASELFLPYNVRAYIVVADTDVEEFELHILRNGKHDYLIGWEHGVETK